jgi:hypothetical protein
MEHLDTAVCELLASPEDATLDPIFSKFQSFSTEETTDITDLLSLHAYKLLASGQLLLFDGMTQNNQCHLNALCVAGLHRKLLSQEPLQRSEDQFITMNFLLASCFQRNKALIFEMIPSVSKNTPRGKLLNEFVNSSAVLGKAREHLVQAIDAYTKKILNRLINNGKSNLLNELGRLCEAGDRAPVGNGRVLTYPKIAGVVLLLEELKREPIPVILKIKFICTHGIHLKTYFVDSKDQSITRLDQKRLEALLTSSLSNESFMVIEGFAISHKGVSEYIEKDRQHCPGFFNKVKKHLPCGTCTPCTPDHACSESLLHDERILGISQVFNHVLLAAGAGFMESLQKDYVAKYFGPNPEIGSFPQLQKIFRSHLHFGAENGLSESNGSTLIVEHLFADAGRYALSIKRLVDTSPEVVVSARRSYEIQ